MIQCSMPLVIIKRLFLIAILVFLVSENCWALEQDAKFWFAVNTQRSLSENKKWLASFFSQTRFIDQAEHWQEIILEGGLGYQLLSDLSMWFGYRWTAHHPSGDFFQSNRLFQQFILQKEPSTRFRLSWRARLEETERSDKSQMSVRLRQKLSLAFSHPLFKQAFPLIYDEVFFPLNDTSYTSNRFVNQNRIFVGFNVYRTKKSWWEIGYINQLEMPTPSRSQYLMAHVVSLTYNFS